MTPQQFKSHRKAKGWDQAKAATEFKVSIHTVRAWEQGKNPIPGLVEKHILSQADLETPLDIVVEINDLAKDMGGDFEPTYYDVLRAGIAALRAEKAKQDAATQQSTSKKRGAKPE